jgi:hypothetical protein
MKNLLLVAVALSVFTVTSFTTLAQPKNDFLKDNNAFEYSTHKYFSAVSNIKSNSNYNRASTLEATESCNPLQFKYAQILNREVETISNTYLYNFIDEWWAVKYRYGGTTKRGVDCSSYTGQLLYTVFGINLPRTAHEQYAKCSRINKYDLREGDLVFFNTRGGISHVGVYLSDGYFTHSSCSAGVTISNLEDSYYSRKFIGGGRVIENIDNEVSEVPSQIKSDL